MTYSTANTIIKLSSAFEVTIEKSLKQLIISVKLITKSPDPNELGGRSVQDLFLEIAEEQAKNADSSARMVNHRFQVHSGLVEGGEFEFEIG